MLKKILVVVMATVCAFGVTGCGKEAIKETTEESMTCVEEKMHKISEELDRSEGQSYYWKYVDDSTWQLICLNVDGEYMWRQTYVW